MLVVAGLLLGSALASHARADLKRMFITSITGDGDIGNWSLIHGQGYSGVAAADRICQVLAVNASLPDPGLFHAWISSSSDDAYCRIAGLSGKLSDHCGVSPLLLALDSGGPWIRQDGYPFSDLQSALAGQDVLFAPPLVDELHATVSPANQSAWTGDATRAVYASGGDPALESCGDWTSASNGASGENGLAWHTAATWDSGGTAACDQPRHLYCFAIGSDGDGLPSFEQPGAIVFVTSAGHDGDLGGLAGGDAICQQAATAGHLPSPGSFRAWLSVPGANAVDRLVTSGPWKRPDGAQVAASKSMLTSGALFTTANEDEAGAYVNSFVWTGTAATGAAAANDCAGWTSADGVSGEVGNSSSTHGDWTELGASDCAFPRTLYCFSTVITLSWDGFESGSLSHWSHVSP